MRSVSDEIDAKRSFKDEPDDWRISIDELARASAHTWVDLPPSARKFQFDRYWPLAAKVYK